MVVHGRLIIHAQFSRQGPFFTLRDNTIRQFITTTYSPGNATEVQNCQVKFDGERDGECASDFQSYLQGTKERTPQGGKSKAVPAVQRTALEILDVAKRNWIGQIDDMFSDSEVIDKHIMTIVTQRKRLEEIMDAANYLQAKRVSDCRIYTWDKIRDTISDSATFGYPTMMSRDDSLSILKWLFRRNFPDYVDKILSLKPWFDMKNKKNTILMLGPPSCGKSWFGTALSKLGCYIGTILNYSKGSSFCFGNTTNCRIIVHDECQWPLVTEYTEVLKMLYGGQSTPVDVKYKNKQTGGNCPVVAMANCHPCKDPKLIAPMQTRCDEWQFIHSMDELKFQTDIPHVYGPCHPLAIFDLYDYIESNEYMDSE